MTLQIGGALGSRIKCTASDGSIIFDTNQRMFVPHTLVTGTKTYAQRTPPFYTVTDTTLATIPSGSTHFIGAIRNNYQGPWSGQPPDDAWWNICGTLLHVWTYAARLAISIRISGTNLIMTEEARMRRLLLNPQGQFSDIPEYDVEYKIYVGRYG